MIKSNHMSCQAASKSRLGHLGILGCISNGVTVLTIFCNNNNNRTVGWFIVGGNTGMFAEWIGVL